MTKWPEKREPADGLSCDWNDAIDACVEAEKQGRLGVEKIAKVLLETKRRWDALEDYKKVSLPTAGVVVFAQAIHAALYGDTKPDERKMEGSND